MATKSDFIVKSGIKVATNATVTGNVTANGFSGNGANLTSVDAILLNGKSEANLNVNSALTSNSASYLDGKTEANLNVNNALTSNNAAYLGGVAAADYQLESGLAANVATLTSNNSTYAFGKFEINLNVNNSLTSNNSLYLGGTAAASYVQNTDSRTLSGNLVFSGANVAFTGNARFSGGVLANSSLGTNGQVLTSNGSSVYWANAASGGSGGGYYKGSNGTVGDTNNKNNIFRINANTLYSNVTLIDGENAQATGPITVDSGVVLTIQTGARVAII